MGKAEDKVVTFLKSMKWKRISSLLDGFLSGFLFGVGLVIILVSKPLEEYLSARIVMGLFILIIVAVAIFVWGVHSALVTKEM